jgi:hypothetical protein
LQPNFRKEKSKPGAADSDDPFLTKKTKRVFVSLDSNAKGRPLIPLDYKIS